MPRPTDRREFLGHLATSAVVLAGAAACAGPIAASAPAQTGAPPRPAPAPGDGAAATHWDDSWFGRLTAKHKAVFDSPQVEDGLVLANAVGYIRGMRDAAGAGENDVQAVVVVRHTAIPMAFNDAMWAKYELGKERKVKDPSTDAWATRNPFLPAANTLPSDRPSPNFAWLAAHGHILLGCDLATRNVAGVLAKRLKMERQVVYEELKANLVPSLILQPTGVYACLRAQEAGCAYLRST
jgi:hypothetical protein